MRIGEIAVPIGEAQTEEIKAALSKINLVSGIGASIETLRNEAKKLENLVRPIEGGVQAPEGYWFTITGSSHNIFELSHYIHKSGYEDSGWSYERNEKFDTESVLDEYVFIAEGISNIPIYKSEIPGKAFAYSPGGKTRCVVDVHSKVDLVPKEQLPPLVVNLTDIPTIEKTLIA
jgi:hypothetical protein